MMVNVANHCDDPNIGMSLTKNLEKFKLYMNDIGLFVTHISKDKRAVDNIIYEKLLRDKLETNLGYVFENMVAQTLRVIGDDLYYFTFPSNSPNRSYEIDFLISRDNKICPIEVKSGGYNTHPSIDEFAKKYSNILFVVIHKSCKRV